jgi:ankyrin repeat protein
MKKALLVLAVVLAAFFAYRWGTRGGPDSRAPLPPPAAPLPGDQPALVEAIQASLRGPADKARLTQLLGQGADPNAVDKSGRTALSLAIRNDDLPALELLLAHGADPNKRDREMQWTPLMTAAYQAARDPKSLPLVELLLAKGADPNAAKDGTTPLHVAVNNLDAKAPDAKVIEALLHGGAKPDGVPVEGPNAFAVRPITLAAWNGKTAAALALARGGANLEGAAATARHHHHEALALALEKLGKPHGKRRRR